VSEDTKGERGMPKQCHVRPRGIKHTVEAALHGTCMKRNDVWMTVFAWREPKRHSVAFKAV